MQRVMIGVDNLGRSLIGERGFVAHFVVPPDEETGAAYSYDWDGGASHKVSRTDRLIEPVIMAGLGLLGATLVAALIMFLAVIEFLDCLFKTDFRRKIEDKLALGGIDWKLE